MSEDFRKVVMDRIFADPKKKREWLKAMKYKRHWEARMGKMVRTEIGHMKQELEKTEVRNNEPTDTKVAGLDRGAEDTKASGVATHGRIKARIGRPTSLTSLNEA